MPVTRQNLPKYQKLYNMFQQDSSMFLNSPDAEFYRGKVSEYENYLAQKDQAIQQQVLQSQQNLDQVMGIQQDTEGVIPGLQADPNVVRSELTNGTQFPLETTAIGSTDVSQLPIEQDITDQIVQESRESRPRTLGEVQKFGIESFLYPQLTEGGKADQKVIEPPKPPMFMQVGANESITGLSYQIATGDQMFDLSGYDPTWLEGIGATVFSFLMPADLLTFAGGGGLGGAAIRQGVKVTMKKTIAKLVANGIAKKEAIKIAAKTAPKVLLRAAGSAGGLGAYNGVHNALFQQAETGEIEIGEVFKEVGKGMALGATAAAGGTVVGKGGEWLGKFVHPKYVAPVTKYIGDLGGEVLSFGALGNYFEGKSILDKDAYLNAAAVIIGMRGSNIVTGKVKSLLFQEATMLQHAVENEGITLKDAVNKRLETAVEKAMKDEMPEKRAHEGEAKVIGEEVKPGKVEHLKGDRERITNEINSIANTMETLKKSGVTKTEIFDNLQRQIDDLVLELNTKIETPDIEVKRQGEGKEPISREKLIQQFEAQQRTDTDKFNEYLEKMDVLNDPSIQSFQDVFPDYKAWLERNAQTDKGRKGETVTRGEGEGGEPPKTVEKPSPIEVQPKLTQEAKKYDSAEEFVDAEFTKPKYGMGHRPSYEDMPPSHNLLEGETLPRNVYTKPDFSIASGRIGSGDKAANESWAALQKIKGKPDAEITIYRASPKNELNAGDWVTFSKEYANQSVEGTEKVHSFKVKAKDVVFAGDDINEFGYYPKSQLTDIWNKAQGKGEVDLTEEAKKYKSADEFVRAQGNAVRQGNIEKGGAYFSTEGSSTYYDLQNTKALRYNISDAKLAQSGTPEMRSVLENAKKLKNTPNELKRIDAALKADNATDNFVDYILFDEVPSIKKSAEQLKYDGVKIWEYDDIADPSSVFIWNTGKIKTKSQLTDIWNKAQGKGDVGFTSGKSNLEKGRIDKVLNKTRRIDNVEKTSKKHIEDLIKEGKIVSDNKAILGTPGKSGVVIGIKLNKTEGDYAKYFSDIWNKAQGVETKLKKVEAPKEVKTETGEKESWEMTRDESVEFWLNRNFYPKGENWHRIQANGTVVEEPMSNKALKSHIDNFIGAHKEAVNQALLKGKPVPESVLKDYPDLARPETPTTPIKTSESGVKIFRVKIKDLFTDLKMFQNRTKAYSEEKVVEIVKNYDERKMEPIDVWVNPEDGKTYVIEGHSRMEALNRLNIEDIDIRYFEGTKKEAIEFAETKNDSKATHTLIDKAKILNKRIRRDGLSNSQAREEAKNLYGKNANTVFALSKLDPNGKAMQTLKSFEKTDDVSHQDVITMAKWVGEIRNKYPELTKSHENEIFDNLIENFRKTEKYKSSLSFMAYIDQAIARNTFMGKFDAEKPINLKGLRSLTPSEVQYNENLNEASKNLNKAKKDLDKRRDELLQRKKGGEDISTEDINRELKRYENDVQFYQKELIDLRMQETDIQRQAKRGIGLFDQIEKTTEQLEKEGISHEQIKKHESKYEDVTETKGEEGLTGKGVGKEKEAEQSQKKLTLASEAKGEQGGIARNLSQRLANLYANLDAIKNKTGEYENMPEHRRKVQLDTVRDLIKSTRAEAESNGIELPLFLGIPSPKMLKDMGKFWRDVFKGREVLTVKEVTGLKTALQISEEKRKAEETPETFTEKPPEYKLKILEDIKNKTEPLPKYAKSINLEKQTLPESLKRLEVELGKITPKKKQTWDETGELAQEILNDYDRAIKVQKKVREGNALTAAEMDALRQINVNAIHRMKEIVDKGEPGKTEEALMDYFQDVFSLTSDASSEIGRALNIHKKNVSENRMAKAFSELKRGLNERELSEFKKINFENPLEVERFIKRLGDPKLMDYVYEYWYNAVLSGIPTHIVNVTSNTTWGAFQMPHRGLAGGLDAMISKFTGKERAMFASEILPMLAGYKTGIGKGAKRAFETVKTGEPPLDLDTKWEIEMGDAISAFERSPNKVLRKIAPFISAPTRALRAMDIYANSIAFDSEINALAHRLGKNKGLKGEELKEFEKELREHPTKEMIDQAIKKAKYSTFMDDPGAFTQGIMKLRGAAPGGRFVVPFVNVIANLTKRGIEMTPGVGLIRGKEYYKSQAAAEIMAKQIEGAVIALYLWNKMDDGDLEMTTGVPKRKSERDAFYRQGKKPWAFKFKGSNEWVQFRRIEPVNNVIASVGIAYEEMQTADENTQTEIMMNVASGIAENFLDGSYVQGISNVLDKHGNRTGMAQRLGASFVPYSSFWRSINRSYEVATEGQATLKETDDLMGAFSQVIPGLSRKRDARLNIWGEEIILEGGVLRQWLPYKWSTETDDPLEIMLEKLEVYPAPPSKHIKVGGKKIEIPDDIYREYLIHFGHSAHKKLTQLTTKPSFKRAKPEAQLIVLNRILTKIRVSELNKVKRQLKP